MSIDGALFDRLSKDQAILALVSTRIHPVELPERPTYPAITYQKLPGGRSLQSHQQPKSGTAGFASFQINAYATTRRTAQQVMAAVRAAIEAYKWSADGTRVYSCWMVDDFDIDRDPAARIEGVGQVYDLMHS